MLPEEVGLARMQDFVPASGLRLEYNPIAHRQLDVRSESSVLTRTGELYQVFPVAPRRRIMQVRCLWKWLGHVSSTGFDAT